MLVIFSVTPFGVGEHLSAEVARAVRIVRDSGLPYQVTPMGTLIEGDWAECMGVIDQCRRAVLEHCPRVAIKLWLDDKPGATGEMARKLEAIRAVLGEDLQT